MRARFQWFLNILVAGMTLTIVIVEALGIELAPTLSYALSVWEAIAQYTLVFLFSAFGIDLPDDVASLILFGVLALAVTILSLNFAFSRPNKNIEIRSEEAPFPDRAVGSPRYYIDEKYQSDTVFKKVNRAVAGIIGLFGALAVAIVSGVVSEFITAGPWFEGAVQSVYGG